MDVRNSDVINQNNIKQKLLSRVYGLKPLGMLEI